jgi:3-hydroxyisobutyrate dehydrogenase-like beta-hydroxyacid dehydrogenase
MNNGFPQSTSDTVLHEPSRSAILDTARDGPLGLIGLGLVGNALARRLIQAGFSVVGRDPDPQACRAAQAVGVDIVDEVGLIAKRCKTIFLSLPDSTAVDQVIWGRSGLSGSCVAGTVLIDTTTAAPEETVHHFRRLSREGVRFLDCPLVGSSREIADGQGVALVGDREERATYAPLLHTFSKQVFFFGEVSRGHTAKLVVNLVLGLNRIVLSEGLGLARRCNLDMGLMLTVLKGSAAYSEVMDTHGELMLSGDFDRPVARLAQHAKDVGLILTLAGATGARVPLSTVHRALLEEAVDAGWGPLDNSAVIDLFVPR